MPSIIHINNQPNEIHGPVELKVIQKELNDHFPKINFGTDTEILIDLFHILKASNAPLILFDRIIGWAKCHDTYFREFGTFGLDKRERFIKNLNFQIYKKAVMLKPRIDRVNLTSARQTSVCTFSFAENVLKILTNKSLFVPKNILLNPENPCGPPTESDFYGEVNTGTWHSDATTKLCTQPNQILMPFSFFIDGLKVDKYGKLTVEAVLGCCMWFNRNARNRASTWFVQGFVEDWIMF